MALNAPRRIELSHKMEDIDRIANTPVGIKKKKIPISKILDNEINVAKILKRNMLDTIGMNVREDYESDLQSRQSWITRSEDAMKLALQVAEEKNFPWPGAANVKYPLLTLAAIQFAARVSLFDSPDIVRCKVNGYDPKGEKTDRAVRIQKHMTYQLQKMPNWEEDNDRMMHALPIIGSMFKKSYYDPVKEYNCSELVYTRDLVFDYYAKSVETAQRKTHVLTLTKNDIIERQRAGLFLDVPLEDEGEVDELPLASETIGMDEPENEREPPRKVLEQHCFLDLDGDDYKEPYIITVDKSSSQVLRIVPRFTEQDIKYNKTGKIQYIKPTEYFTQFTFIPDPNGGNLGIGFGHLQGPINETINTLINQLLDAGTQNNLQSGFIGKGLRTRAGNYDFAPGEWKPVQSTGEDIARNIVPLPTKEPSQVLFTLLSLMLEGGERIGSITDAIVGDNPPANTPATTTMATIEQGLKVFKRVHKRLYSCFTKEFQKLYDLNKKYLPPQEYFTVLDIPEYQMKQLMEQTQQAYQIQKQMIIVPSDYQADDTDVSPSADPNIITEAERLQKVEMLIQTAPIMGWNPQVLKKRFIEAANFPNPDELMQPPPPAAPDPEIELKKMELQLKQQQMQMDAQTKAQEMQFKQVEMALEAERAKIESEKIKMEIAKIEAEIRKILSEIEDDGEDGVDKVKLELEAKSLIQEYDIKSKELLLKEAELALKNKEIELSGAVKDREIKAKEKDSENKLKATGMPDMNKMMTEILDSLKSKKKIVRDANGMLVSVGNMRVKRDNEGKATEIEPMEEEREVNGV